MLSSWLASELFAVMLVFCRVGTAVMVLPGFGELYVPMRVRLFFALAFSLVLAPAIAHMPPLPEHIYTLVVIIVGETLVGFFIGMICRILVTTVSIAGTIISLQANLASLMTVDITQIQGQAQVLSNFIGMAALVLLFSTGLHHLMLQAIADSYTLFLPGAFPNMGDLANHSSETLNEVFIMAVQMSGPFIVIGTILYLGIGILSRLVPNVQAFFVMTAPQIMLNFFLLMVLFNTLMLWYLDFFKNTLSTFLAP